MPGPEAVTDSVQIPLSARLHRSRLGRSGGGLRCSPGVAIVKRGEMMMKAAILMVGLGISAAAALTAAPAHADDGPDPHMPNGGALWCQGGLGNVAMIPYCDGLHYPDGSFWHQEAASPFGFGGPASLPWKPPVLVKP